MTLIRFRKRQEPICTASIANGSWIYFSLKVI